MNKNQIFDESDIDENMLIMAQYQPENDETYELVSITATSTYPDIKSYISDLIIKSDTMSSVSDDLPATSWNKHVDEISAFNNSRERVEEKIIRVQPESDLGLYEEIAENELDVQVFQFDERKYEVNTKLSQLKDVVGDAIGSEKLEEDFTMSSISEELSATNRNKHVDDISSFDNYSKIVEEKVIKVQPESVLDLCQEMAENKLDSLLFDEHKFEVNTNLSQLNYVVENSIGSEEFQEGKITQIVHLLCKI
ncbi:uncharacterized protein LOC111617681 [Centruroides sculpturatus]|uniref:uncharacterized protein LOC111617681 n=1 Tax=Centruroides sculpturatus TaxID=218467 RepID=UPI000C6DAB00|nr:uncharacterized protein LOC111617681 [Centruroides sculpturatus]